MTRTTNRIKALHYALGPGVVAFSTERDTTHPDESYSGFNACYYTHGDPDEVAVCRNAVKNMLPGIRALLIPRQTHSLNLLEVNSYDMIDPVEIDGMITALPGVALAINTADCVPVLMADADAGVIAAVHSGWRGTIGHIAAMAIEKMKRLGALPSRVRVATGPSICPDCFEVGPDIAEIFEQMYGGMPGIVSTAYGDRPHIDLRNAIIADLMKAGVNPSNINTVTAPCSRCNWETWWSARKLGINSGRTLSLIYRQ